jgi:inosose dehydratase
MHWEDSESYGLYYGLCIKTKYLLKFNVMKSRRNFLKLTGTGILAAGVTTVYGSSLSPLPPKKNPAPDTFSVGMAGFTFMQFNVEKTIEMMKRIGVDNLSLKEFQMPLNSTREQINIVLGKFKAAGINIYTLGVIYMKTQDSVDQAFEYAKMAGVKMIVGAPNYELLPYVEKKVKEYDIRLAIHNHGPDNPLYPNATDIWNHIKALDPRMGICIDIGHTTRDGQDPSVDIERYKSRIFDMHIKDVDKAAKEGKTIEMGRGIINIPKVVATLRKIKYSGKCSLEFEKDMSDPLAGIAESIGYFKGVMACK